MVSIEANAYDCKVGKIYYNLDNETKEATVTYYDLSHNYNENAYQGDITIPQSIVYKEMEFKVTSIGRKAFYHCGKLTSITIPGSITSIGSEAFRNTYILTSVTIRIKDLATWCTSPLDLSSLSSSCIRYLYLDGKEVTKLIIPDGVSSIADGAFQGCCNLTATIIPNSVKNIGEKAFYNTRLKSVTIGAGVLSVGSEAFGYSSLSGCKPLKVIWLTNTPPDGYNNAEGEVNYVANDLYTSLNNQKLYPFLSSIFEVGGVKYVPVSPSERTCDAIDCNYDKSAEKVYIGKTTSFKGVNMSVKTIQPYVCYQNPNIQEVLLENDGVVPKYAFYNCVGLTSVIVSNQGNIDEFSFASSVINGTLIVKNTGNIGTSAFSGITGSFPANINNVGSIAFAAFKESTGLKDLEIGNKVTDLGNNSFYGCTGLTSVIVSNQGNIGESAFASSVINGTLTVNNTGNIGISAFRGITGSFPANINNTGNIASSAFRESTGLIELEIGNKVTDIGDNSFEECTGLTNVAISNHGNIGEFAFASSMINGVLTINNIGSLGAFAFSKIAGSFSANINNAGNVASSAFKESTGLTALEIGDNVTIVR
ncbi:MAG: leucine-rich repeat domain-containing protein [Prevotellaceae bacterium]|nr:leucine-rich repeat domain-containing protein [Prevotellaceae bacterium]